VRTAKRPRSGERGYRSEEASGVELLWTSLCELLRLMVQISDDRVVGSTIKKVVERLQKLHFEHEFVWAFRGNFATKKIEDVAFGQRQCPQELLYRNLLGGTIRAEPLLSLFDVALGFGDQPFREVEVEFMDICAKFVGRDVTETPSSKIGM
jgi:hypothetical protein